MEKIGCAISIIVAAGLSIFLLTEGAGIWAALFMLVIGSAYFMSKFMEGLSKGSGYRQEQQNKEILEELKKRNK